MNRITIVPGTAFLFLLLQPYFGGLSLALLPSGSVFLFQFFFILFICAIALLSRKVFLHYREAPPASPAPSSPEKREHIIVFSLAVLIFFIAADTFILRYRAEPLGQWDAWAIWQPRTRDFSLSFLRGLDVSFFRSDWAHPDYAPLAALSVAGPLIVVGEWSVSWMPAAMNFLYYVTLVALLLLALRATLKGSAVVGLVVFTGAALSPMLFINATDQCADHYLALIFLGGFVLLDRLPSRTGIMLSGFCAASLPLIKNEGMFLLLALAWYATWLLVWERRSRREFCYFLLAMIFPLLLFILYKLTANRLQPYETTVGHMIEMLLDPERHAAVLVRWLDAHLVLSLAYLPVSWILVRPQKQYLVGSLGILLVFLVYHLIFVVTPADQKWHLDTAFTRITVVVYPAWAFLLLRSLGAGGFTKTRGESSA